ncbi:MAG: AMP-binding protein, partial [Syntrophomonadaceae bacterium]|nr:AMP-binding protein [Syntrophomonadaceae bacterium]
MYNHVEGLTVSQAFYRNADLYHDQVAQLFNPELYQFDNNGIFTWNEMKNRVEIIASGLLALGVKKQDRVGIMAANSPYWTHVDVATINCGAVLVTIYPTLSRHEVTYIVNDSQCEILFVGNQQILNAVLPALEQMPSLKKIIVICNDIDTEDERILSLQGLMILGRNNSQVQFPVYESRWKENKPADWATILYTSGTTGIGKGVILTHECFTSRVDGTFEYFNKVGHPLTNEDRVLSFLPLSHIFDRVCSQWAALSLGASIAYADSPATLINDLPHYNPTWFSCVPRLYEKIYMQFQQQLLESSAKKKLFDWALRVGQKVLDYRIDSHGRIDMRPDFNIKSKLPLGLHLQYAIA